MPKCVECGRTPFDWSYQCSSCKVSLCSDCIHDTPYGRMCGFCVDELDDADFDGEFPDDE